MFMRTGTIGLLLMLSIGLRPEPVAAEEQELDLGAFEGTEGDGSLYVDTAPKAILDLNRFTFAGNALRPSGDHSESYVVMFCAPWFEPCQELGRTFDRVGSELQTKLNTDLISLKVRFANVDCASDKVLCNQQFVDSYPTIVHYRLGKPVGYWTGMDKRQLRKWVERAVHDEPAPAENADTRADGAIDIALAIAAIVGSLYLVSRNPDLKPADGRWTASRAAAPEEARPQMVELLPATWRSERASSVEL